jgi:hypothetical protein
MIATPLALVGGAAARSGPSPILAPRRRRAGAIILLPMYAHSEIYRRGNNIRVPSFILLGAPNSAALDQDAQNSLPILCGQLRLMI